MPQKDSQAVLTKTSTRKVHVVKVQHVVWNFDDTRVWLFRSRTSPVGESEMWQLQVKGNRFLYRRKGVVNLVHAYQPHFV